MAPKGPFRIVTVNAAGPENSKKLVDAVVADVKDEYIIDHVGDFATLEEVEENVATLKPDAIFVASSYEPEHSHQIHQAAIAAHPEVKVCIIPHGTQAEKGPQGVVDYAKAQLEALFG